MPTTPGNIRSCRISREQNYSGSSYRYVVTPQMADIYAVATMYGAATTTRTGDTVYGFNSNAGAIFSFSAYTSAPALTIYDNGGSDTLDCSRLFERAEDRPSCRQFFVGRRTDQQYRHCAQRVIEKAIGGTGNDTLIANDLGCTLIGRRRRRYADRRRGHRPPVRRQRRRHDDRRRRRRQLRVCLRREFGQQRPARPDHRLRFRRRSHRSFGDRRDLRHGGAGPVPLPRHCGLRRHGRRAELLLQQFARRHDTPGRHQRRPDRGFCHRPGRQPRADRWRSDRSYCGSHPVIIESFGSTQLLTAASEQLRSLRGASSTVNQICRHRPDCSTASLVPGRRLHAEQSASGYTVVLKFGSADQFTIWSIDANGNYISNTSAMTNTDLPPA